MVDALAGTILAGRQVAVEGFGLGRRPALVVPCAPDELLAAWSAARAVLDRTGRWPVVVTDWLGGGTFEAALNGAAGAASPEAICARAEAVDPDAALAEVEALADAERWEEWDDEIRFELEATAATHGSSPGLADVRVALGDDPGRRTLERWLFAWELAAESGRTTPEPPVGGHLDWYVPSDECAVVLLPTVDGWQAPAWVPFFGAEGEGGTERLIAVMRTWHDRFGAEIVAHWGTMLQFVVGRPPATAAEAFPVAMAHDLLATATLPLPGVSVRAHARALVGRPTWFLHDRP